MSVGNHCNDKDRATADVERLWEWLVAASPRVPLELHYYRWGELRRKWMEVALERQISQAEADDYNQRLKDLYECWARLDGTSVERSTTT